MDKRKELEKLTDEEVNFLMTRLEVKRAREEQETVAREAELLKYVAYLEERVHSLEKGIVRKAEKAIKKAERAEKLETIEKRGRQAFDGFKNKLPKINVEWNREEGVEEDVE